MCIKVFGRRQCAICGIILSTDFPLPADARSILCALHNRPHKTTILYNHAVIVCACCRECVRVGVARGLISVGRKGGMKALNAEAVEFVPWWVACERELGWYGGFWYHL